MAPGGIISLVSFQPWVWQSRLASPWHFLYKTGSNLDHNTGSKALVFNHTFNQKRNGRKSSLTTRQRGLKSHTCMFFFQKSWRSEGIKLQKISRTYFQSLAIKYCSSSSRCSQSSTIFSVYRCSIRHDRILQHQQHKYRHQTFKGRSLFTTAHIHTTYTQLTWKR